MCHLLVLRHPENITASESNKQTNKQTWRILTILLKLPATMTCYTAAPRLVRCRDALIPLFSYLLTFEYLPTLSTDMNAYSSNTDFEKCFIFTPQRGKPIVKRFRGLSTMYESMFFFTYSTAVLCVTSLRRGPGLVEIKEERRGLKRLQVLNTSTPHVLHN